MGDYSSASSKMIGGKVESHFWCPIQPMDGREFFSIRRQHLTCMNESDDIQELAHRWQTDCF
jgi:hypothetical protein